MLKQSDQKQSIKVAIRVRPILDKQFNDDVRTCVRVEDTHLHLISSNQTKKFAFDNICFNQSQQQIFDKLGKKCAKDCLEGYNCTIFAYGQTGAGKTYTMMGLDFDNQSYYENRGLIPRTIEYLFKCIGDQQEKGVNFIIKCSYLEIYNEQIIDLLNKPNMNLQLREDTKKGVYVEGISSEIVTKTEEAMNILEKGSKSRHVSSTLYNETSSRSHSVFSFEIESKFTKNGVSTIKCRQFNFIDLAGSQRTKLSTGERLREGCNINKSLMNLSSVINALSEVSQGKLQHINYRSSKLTFLLKDSLGGNSKTNLIANIHPAAVFYQQTLSTLGFARRAKLIKRSKALINEDSLGSLQSMKKEIKRLNQQLLNVISQSHNSSFDNKFIEEKPAKMTYFMSQFIDQEIDKQTRFQAEILRLTKRISHLQEGIKQYSNNQIHLKMIIGVHEDKISRLKKIELNLNNKVSKLDQNNQQSKNIIQYFKKQRNDLIKLVQSGYRQSQSTQYLKQLLKQAKMIKQEGNDGVLRDILLKNTDYLTIINSKLNEMKPEAAVIEPQTQMSKRIQQINNQFDKRQEQLQQRLDQASIELSQHKNRIEQNQKLLQESVNAQIILQQKVKQLQQVKKQLSRILANQQKIIEQQSKQLKGQIFQLKEQNQRLKLEKHHYEQSLGQFAFKQSQYQRQLKQINDRVIQIMNIDSQKDQNNAKQLQILNAIISECNKKVKQYRQSYQAQLDNNKKLICTNDKLNEQLIQMKIALRQAKQQLNLSKQMINKNQQQTNMFSGENKKLQQINKELNTRNLIFQQQILSMEQKIEKSQKQMIKYHNKLSQKTVQFKNMQQNRQTTQNLLIQNSKLHVQLQNSSSLIKQLTIQNSAIKQKLYKYETYHRKISKQLQDLYSYKQKKEIDMGELDCIQQQIIAQISLKQKIYKELTKQKGQNLEMKRVIQKLTQQNKELKQQIEQRQNLHQKLIEKYKSQQRENRKSTSSEHYLKTIQLLEKSRTEHIELKRQNDEIKKVMLTLKQSITQKQTLLRQIQHKNRVNTEKLQKKLDNLQKEYSELKNNYQNLKKQRKNSEKFIHDNEYLKDQIKHLRSSAQKIAQKNQEMEVKIKKASLNSKKLQRQYEQIKRSDSLTLASEDKSTYVHKLKAQIASLKTQRALLSQSLNKEREENIRLKQQIKYGSNEIKLKHQLQKKFNQNKNLTQFIFQIINQLKICVTQPKAKLQVIRSLILGKIKQTFEEVKTLKEQIKGIQKNIFMHGPTVNDYTPSKQSKQLKAINTSSNQRFLTQQSSYKYDKYKDTAAYLKKFSSQNMRDFQKFNTRLKYNENQTKKRSYE